MRKMHARGYRYARVMDLELRHLRCLVAIVDTGSFTDAAIELGLSQAAVSRTLMSLEAVLGVRLLHRTSRTVTPTTAGVQVLARARQLCEKLLSYASPLQLYAEEIDPRTGRHLGNFPQAFTHLALINAVMHVIRAEAGADPSSFAPPAGPFG